jgi:hypothetical protein
VLGWDVALAAAAVVEAHAVLQKWTNPNLEPKCSSRFSRDYFPIFSSKYALRSKLDESH